MLNPEKIAPALYAIHRILVQARWLAGEAADAKKLYTVLDHAEILPVLIGNTREESDFFLSMLKSLGESFPEFAGIAEDYALGVCGQGISPAVSSAANS